MPSSPYVLCLSDAERAGLESVSRRATAPHRLVLRSRIVLLAAGGAGNSGIARRLGWITGPLVPATRYKITRDGPAAKLLLRQFEANSQTPLRAC